jgi:hypothetical protein
MGTRGTWTSTERTETFLGASAPTGNGTRTRSREFVVHPDAIKRLRTGYAAVTSPGHDDPRIARMNHPKTPDDRERETAAARHAAAHPGRRRAPARGQAERSRPLRHAAVPDIGRHIRFTRAMLEEWLQGRVA